MTVRTAPTRATSVRDTGRSRDALQIQSSAVAVVATALLWNPLGLQEFQPIKLFVAGLAVLWGLRSMVRSGTVAVPEGSIWLGSFVGLVLLSAGFSDDIGTAIFGYADRHLGVIGWLLLTGSVLLGCGLKPEQQRLVVSTLVAVTGAVAVLAIAQRLGLSPFADVATSGGRVTSTFGSATFLAGFLVLGGPCAVMVAADGSRPTLHRRLGALAAVAAVVALLLSESRGAWIGAVVALAVGVWALRRSGLLGRTTVIAITSGVVASAAVGLALPAVRSRFATLFSPGSGTAGGRWVLWRAALRTIADRPLLGFGPDLTRLGLPSNLPADFEAVYGDSGIPDRAHNAVLDIAIWLGVPAAVVGIVFVFIAGRSIVRRIQPGTSVSTVGIVAALAGFAGHLAFNFTQFELDVVAALLLGIALAGGARSIRVADAAGLAATLGLVLATGAFAVWAGGAVLADTFARSAVDAEERGDTSGARSRWADARDASFGDGRYGEGIARFEMRAGDPLLAVDAAAVVSAGHPDDPFFAELHPLALATAAAATQDAAMAAQAEELYRRLIDQWHDHGSYHTGLGVALAVQGRVDEAIASFTEAHRLTPDRIEPLRNLALLAAAAGDSAAANDYLTQAIALEPDNPDWGLFRQRLDEQLRQAASAGTG